MFQTLYKITIQEFHPVVFNRYYKSFLKHRVSFSTFRQLRATMSETVEIDLIAVETEILAQTQIRLGNSVHTLKLVRNGVMV